MIEKFQEEAYARIGSALGLQGETVREYLLQLSSSLNEDGVEIAKEIKGTCVFNIANFLLQYITTTKLSEQDCYEMLWQIAAKLYQLLSKNAALGLVKGLECRRSFPAFFDDFLSAIKIYLRTRGEELGAVVLQKTGIRSVRSGQQPVEAALQMPSNCK